MALTERRYRRNRCAPFYRYPVRVASVALGGACPSPTTAGAVGGVPPNLQPARRSVSAATDAIGLCVFIDALCELQVHSRDCTPRALPRASRSGRHVGLRPPRNDNSGAGAVLAAAGTGCECSAGSGMPLPYNAYTKTPNGRGLRPGHGFYTRREEGWKTCAGILLTFRASASGSWRSVRGSR